ncbi:hypothetical protein DQ04_14021000 [Trypanosoma grayi]|uniref:hypothetical protein n=1 Tax=Trypanosoma grayi TaxID=71804 RepID=UPI0004F46A66|nr:hypothetical protein DQ04_14021000 [Trypanosoma grayi]KEG06417.1 hypothetical protein DQ04_14021000 [Trypanosoma grayi]
MRSLAPRITRQSSVRPKTRSGSKVNATEPQGRQQRSTAPPQANSRAQASRSAARMAAMSSSSGQRGCGRERTRCPISGVAISSSRGASHSYPATHTHQASWPQCLPRPVGATKSATRTRLLATTSQRLPAHEAHVCADASGPAPHAAVVPTDSPSKSAASKEARGSATRRWPPLLSGSPVGRNSAAPTRPHGTARNERAYHARAVQHNHLNSTNRRRQRDRPQRLRDAGLRLCSIPTDAHLPTSSATQKKAHTQQHRSSYSQRVHWT